MIASGEKKEEYREIKPYWIKRFFDKYKFEGDVVPVEKLFEGLKHGNILREETMLKHLLNPFEVVSANNGYSKNCPNIKWKHEGITIGKPNPKWCEAADVDKIVFILKIGELIKP